MLNYVELVLRFFSEASASSEELGCSLAKGAPMASER